MTVVTKTIGRLPVNLGDYDNTKSYGRKNRVFLYGCEFESLMENNTYAPMTWDGAETFTEDTVHWKRVSGSPEAWIAGQDKPAASEQYPNNGMGRVVLKKNMVGGVNTLTKAAFEDSEGNDRGNTIYVIQYDFTLGEDITVPENCVLEFDGGSVSGNGTGKNTITGSYTQIIAQDVAIFNNGIVIAGTWICPRIPSDWFGDVTRTNRIGQLVNLSSDNVDNHIVVKPGTYNIDIQTNWTSPLTLKSNTKFELLGTIQLLPNDLSNDSVIFIYNADHEPENIEICGNGSIIGDKLTHTGTFGEWSDGIDIKRGRNIRVSGITISNVFGYGINLGGSSPSGAYITHDVTIDGCTIKECRAVGIAVIMAQNTIIENCNISNIVDIFYHSGRTQTKMMECAIDIEPNEEYGIDTLIIRNNYIVNKRGICSVSIGVGTIQNVEISNNKIIYSKYDGIEVTSGLVKIDNNFISKTTLDNTNPGDTDSVETTNPAGISCNVKTIITNNTIVCNETDTYYGVYLTGAGTIFENNTITSQRLYFENCKVYKNVINSWTVDVKFNGCEIAGNNLTIGGPWAGVGATIASCIIKNNKISCTQSYVFSITGGNCIISNNDFTLNNPSAAYIISQNNNIPKFTIFSHNFCDLSLAVDSTFSIQSTQAIPICLSAGPTPYRPTLHADYKGTTYFDSDLGKEILWNGSAWVNVDGSALS